MAIELSPRGMGTWQAPYAPAGAVQNKVADSASTEKMSLTALLGHAFEGGLEDYVKMVVKDMLPEIAREFPGITVDANCDRDAWSVEACVRLFEKARKHLAPAGGRGADAHAQE